MTTSTYIIEHPALGQVIVRLNPQATRISGRWKQGKVQLTAPARAAKYRISQALDLLAQRLLERKPQFGYRENQSIICPGITFTIVRQNFRPDMIIATRQLPETKIQVGTNIDMDSETAIASISKALCSIANHYAPGLLLPRAKEIAESIGIAPEKWRIGRGLRTLGTCSSGKTITLSSALVFLPQELRDYIVCHELAHLTEMNHSATFHALCNRYCGGKETELRARLKTFPFPVLR